MNKKDRYIVECARRMVRKLESSRYWTLNGEFPKPVRDEIEKMRKHCLPESK